MLILGRGYDQSPDRGKETDDVRKKERKGERKRKQGCVTIARIINLQNNSLRDVRTNRDKYKNTF